MKRPQAGGLQINRQLSSPFLSSCFDTPVLRNNCDPFKGDLQRVMEVSDIIVSTDQQPAPNHRVDVANPDVDLVDLPAVLFVHTTARISGISGRLK